MMSKAQTLGTVGLLWLCFSACAADVQSQSQQTASAQTDEADPEFACMEQLADDFPEIEVWDLAACMGQATNVAPMNLDDEMEAGAANQNHAIGSCITTFGEAAVRALLACWHWSAEDIDEAINGAIQWVSSYDLLALEDLPSGAEVHAPSADGLSVLTTDEVNSLEPGTPVLRIGNCFIAPALFAGVLAALITKAWFSLQQTVASAANAVSVIALIPKPLLELACTMADPSGTYGLCAQLGVDIEYPTGL